MTSGSTAATVTSQLSANPAASRCGLRTGTPPTSSRSSSGSTRRRPGMGSRVLARCTSAAVLLVAAIAAAVSFIHIQHLAAARGQDPVASVLLPASIDGTIAAASLVMLRAARAGLGTPWLARGMLTLAVVATRAANVGYGLPYGIPGALISGWPAVAFIGCAEMAIGMVRRVSRAVPAAVPAGRRPAKPPGLAKIKTEVGVGQDKARKVQRLIQAAAAPIDGGRDAPQP